MIVNSYTVPGAVFDKVLADMKNDTSLPSGITLQFVYHSIVKFLSIWTPPAPAVDDAMVDRALNGWMAHAGPHQYRMRNALSRALEPSTTVEMRVKLGGEWHRRKTDKPGQWHFHVRERTAEEFLQQHRTPYASFLINTGWHHARRDDEVPGDRRFRRNIRVSDLKPGEFIEVKTRPGESITACWDRLTGQYQHRQTEEDPHRGSCRTVGVGRVPDQSQGLLSLHIGPSHVILTRAEARQLSADIELLASDFSVRAYEGQQIRS